MKRTAMVCLLGLLTYGSLRAAEDPFRSEAGKFSVMFPSKPMESSKEIESPIGMLTIHTTALEARKDLGLIVVYVDYPNLIQQQKPQEVLSRTRDGTKGPADKIVDDQEIMINQVPGREYLLVKEGGIYYRSRILLDGTRLYQVIVSGVSKDEVNSAAATKFLESFAITK